MHQALSLTTLQAFPDLLLTSLRGGCNYYPYFTDDKTEAPGGQVLCPRHSASDWRSASPGRAASVSADFGRGSGHKGSGLGGLAPVLQLSQGDAPSRDTRAQDAGPGPPPSPPRGPLSTRSLHPGAAGGASSASALGRGGPGGGRAVPGGCPAKPPPTAACPRRAWCRAAGLRAGRKDGGQEARPPRLLPAPETRRTLCARDRPARATPAQWPPPPPARRPSSQPSPPLHASPRSSPPAPKTGSVASARPDAGSVAAASAAPAPCGKPQTRRRPRGLSSSWGADLRG